MRNIIPLPVSFAALAIAGSAIAQLQPGDLLLTTRHYVGAGATWTGAMYRSSVANGVPVRLAIPTALESNGVRALLMTSSSMGFVATNPSNGSNPEIWSITLSGNTVTGAVLNTAPIDGAYVHQMAILDNDIWFMAPHANGWWGRLWKVPLVGGAPTMVASTQTQPWPLSWGSTLFAFAVRGRKGYTSCLRSGSGAEPANGLYEIDLDNPTSAWTSLVSWNSGASAHHLGFDPGHPDEAIFVDWTSHVYRFNVATMQWGTGGVAGWGYGATSAASRATSFVAEPRTGDLLIGAHSHGYGFNAPPGTVDVHPRGASGSGLGLVHVSEPGVPQVSVYGIHYEPITQGQYTVIGHGCGGVNPLTVPATFTAGTPVSPNPTFGLGLLNGIANDLAVLVVGFQNTTWQGVPLPVALPFQGVGPCLLHVGVDVTLLGIVPDNGSYAGMAMRSLVLPVPIPAGLSGATLYTQWGVIKQGNVHSISEGRRLVVQ